MSYKHSPNRYFPSVLLARAKSELIVYALINDTPPADNVNYERTSSIRVMSDQRMPFKERTTRSGIN